MSTRIGLAPAGAWRTQVLSCPGSRRGSRTGGREGIQGIAASGDAVIPDARRAAAHLDSATYPALSEQLSVHLLLWISGAGAVFGLAGAWCLRWLTLNLAGFRPSYGLSWTLVFLVATVGHIMTRIIDPLAQGNSTLQLLAHVLLVGYLLLVFRRHASAGGETSGVQVDPE